MHCRTEAAFGFSIKASARQRTLQARPVTTPHPSQSPTAPQGTVLLWPQATPAVLLRKVLCVTVALLAGLSAPQDWYKVLGAWEGDLKTQPCCSKRLLFEDIVHEQLTGQEQAEQEPGAGALQEAWGQRLPGLHCAAQHGREVPAMNDRGGSVLGSAQPPTPPSEKAAFQVPGQMLGTKES